MDDDLKSWDAGADVYLGTASGETDPFKRLVDTPAFITLLGNIKDKLILDIGCGDGLFCRKLSNLGAKVIGLEGSPRMIAIAKKNYPECKFILCDLKKEKIPFKKKLDVVTAKMMLMNISDINLVVKRAFRILKKNGLFAIDIVHPCRPIIKNLLKKEKKYQGDINYFKEKRIPARFGNRLFSFYHRPLSKYINDILDAGFTLLKVQEPCPNKKIVVQYPEEKDKLKYPTSLHLLFKKIP